MTAPRKPRLAKKRCPVCLHLFQPRRGKQRVCGVLCRNTELARRQRPGKGAKPKPEWVGRRVRLLLDDPRCGADRQGEIVRDGVIAGRPLLTVQLDRAGWPGGTDRDDGGAAIKGARRRGVRWYVELRPNEVELLS